MTSFGAVPAATLDTAHCPIIDAASGVSSLANRPILSLSVKFITHLWPIGCIVPVSSIGPPDAVEILAADQFLLRCSSFFLYEIWVVELGEGGQAHMYLA